MNSEADDGVELNEEISNDMEKDVKVVDESLRFLSFFERMKGLSPHHRHLKDQMRDKTVSYVNLLRPGPPPSRRDDKPSRRLATQK
jgi:hypothetical protein